MIYTINSNNFLLYPAVKSALGLSDNDVYKMINNDFSIMLERLKMKDIEYKNLKNALIPDQKKNKNEICFVFDSSLISNHDYGMEIFSKFIPLMNKKSIFSILAGDYTDVLYDQNESQKILHDNLEEKIIRFNSSAYKYSGQYFMIYINRLSDDELLETVEGLSRYKWFYGYVPLDYDSVFKSYLSFILPHVCIKYKNIIIGSHAEDLEDEQNVNERGFPFEENSYKYVSINELSFGAFLSYKIESILPDRDDVSFSLNALFPKFDSLDKLNLKITDGLMAYLNDDLKGKGGIMRSVGLNTPDKTALKSTIFKKICGKCIYCIDTNEFGRYKFNVCIELPTVNGNIRKTTIALMYYPDSGEMEVITIT